MNWWSPWHGCHKISPGCRNCYVYARDAAFGKDSAVVAQTGDFALPLKRNRHGAYKLPPGQEIFTCGTSDFFLEEADEWRKDAWVMIKARQDLRFFIVTKRISRFAVSLPADWGEGYDNVIIGCTCENQMQADARLPLFLEAPIRHRAIIAEPLLEHISLERYLDPQQLEQVIVGGESGENARVCCYDWVLDIRQQCQNARVRFQFKQTGARFQKDGRLFCIERRLQHIQAKKAGIDLTAADFWEEALC